MRLLAQQAKRLYLFCHVLESAQRTVGHRFSAFWLNFGDRTRTGVFSMIWPLTRRVLNNQAFQLGSEDLFEKVSTDGANLEKLFFVNFYRNFKISEVYTTKLF